MRELIVSIFIFQFSFSYSAKLTKDVVYLPSTAQDFSEDLPVKKSSLSSKSATPIAWIAGEINKNPLKQITICTWVKSLDQGGTGTIFAYVTSNEKIEFGLVGTNTKGADKDERNPHEVYVVIKGKRSKLPINLGLDDARWHHICITWSSRYGIWKVFKDGENVERGFGMKRGKTISPGGRYYIGGGVFKWVEEEELVNGSDTSQVDIRVSSHFHTASRTKRNVYSTESKRMIGKFTDLYIWKKVVSKAQITTMSNCRSDFRRLFQREVKKVLNYANIFRTMRRKSARKSSILAWAARNVLFAWSEDAITLQRPATLELSGNLCGYTISIDCETNRMLVSVEMALTKWYDVEGEDIHLADRSCIPEQRGDYLVFQMLGMTSCGTQRQIVGREVHYTNTISNSPMAGGIYVGQLFIAQTVCKFPLDVSASTAPIVPGRVPEVAGKVTVTDPRTGKPDLEAVFVLSVDDQFTDPLRQGNTLSTRKPVWAGIAIEGTYTNGAEGNVNVVVDECWTETESGRSPLLNQQGCEDSPARVLENGEKPKVIMEVPTRDMKPSVSTYIGCSFHPCVGDACTPNCETTSNNRPSSTRTYRRRRQRDIVEEAAYEIRIGPFFATEEIIDDDIPDDMTEESEDDEESGPDMLLLAIVLPSTFVFILILAGCMLATYLLTRKTGRAHTITRTWGDDNSRRKSKRPIRAHSFIFCRPSYSAYDMYPPSFHTIVRAKFQAPSKNDVIEENDVVYHQNTNTMISTVH